MRSLLFLLVLIACARYRPCVGQVLNTPRSGNITSIVICLIANRNGSNSYTGSGGAIPLAFTTLQSQGLLPNINFTLRWIDANSYSPVTMVQSVISALQTGADVFFGPPTFADSVAYALGGINFPFWNWVLMEGIYNNYTNYPTLVKSSAYPVITSRVVAESITYFGYYHVAMVFNVDTTVAQFCNDQLPLISSWLTARNATIAGTWMFTGNPTTSQIMDNLQLLTTTSRAFLICATRNQINTILYAANTLGITSSDYVYFVLQTSPYTMSTTPWSTSSSLYATNDTILEVFDQVFFITLYSASLPTNNTFTNLMSSILRNPPYNVNQQNNRNQGDNSMATFLYDLTRLYMITLSRAISLGMNIRDGVAMQNLVSNTTMTAAMSGSLTFGPYAQRMSSGFIWCLNQSTLIYNTCIFMQAKALNDTTAATSLYKPVIYSTITWDNPSNMPPPDVPICGYDGSLCTYDNTAAVRAGIIAGAIVCAILLVGLLFYYLKKRREAINKEQIWRINSEEVTLKAMNTRTNTKSSLTASAETESLTGTSLTSTSAMSDDAAGSKIAGLRDSKIELGIYHGDTVVIKRFRILNPNYNTRESLTFLRMMKELSNQNVNGFVGACIDNSISLFMITRFCSRGSVRDVIKYSASCTELRLDNTFKLAFITDIANGMSFLQDTVFHSHGNLKTTNCLVDNRWTVKIADFGLWNLRLQVYDDRVASDVETLYKNMYFTAPELLRTASAPVRGTVAGDMYSFAIVFWEIVFEDEPYHGENPQGVIANVRSGGVQPYRPKVQQHETELAQFIQLMRDCWAEDPTQRPSFGRVKARLREISGGREIVLVDEMMSKMEKYTIQLEETVNQRTAALAEEKHKADLLLCRMLPPTIAECLKSGRTVAPESYECASVMFTDIVRFTCIASHSTPMQMVNCLNYLYNEFDSIIKNHDAYKVETIGDAYMICSGLPVRNGLRHAAELADVALGFLTTVLNYRVQHLPDVPLMIRLGIDSGPCCAGVIGSLMPHFCLFGDTVNSASRMESHGKPLMIHITENTNNILQGFGVYTTVPRGATEIKGKGTMTTYWLQRKQGYTGRLPSDEDFIFSFDSRGLPRRGAPKEPANPGLITFDQKLEERGKLQKPDLTDVSL